MSIEYRRTDENKEDTIRDHYLNLHSGDIFCNPKEKIRIKIRKLGTAASKKKGRKCVSTGAAGAQIRRSLGHHLLHPQIFTN